ncbi:hypothetical protein HMPREF9074_09450, partial [Capnocytophaga sp. oral taxon 329 str. F0087]
CLQQTKIKNKPLLKSYFYYLNLGESKYKVYYTTMLLMYADHYISPFEGSPRAGAAEYVQRGDVIYERYRNTEKT